MSRLCRLKSYKSIGEDGVWAYNEIISLRTTIAEQAEWIKALERELGLAEVTIDEMSSAAIKQFKRIKELEDALRASRGALNSQFIVGCGAWQIEQKNAIAKINEMIGV